MENQKELEGHKFKLLQFVTEILCKRPSMWVGSNDFEKIAHFYNGYTRAVQTHLGLDLYRGWSYWVADQLKPKFMNHAWWSVILEHCGSDELAIELFPKLLKQYFDSKEFSEFSKNSETGQT